MRRIFIQRPKSKRERPWLEVLPLEPRDLDVVRAKALDRSSVATRGRDRGPGLTQARDPEGVRRAPDLPDRAEVGEQPPYTTAAI